MKVQSKSLIMSVSTLALVLTLCAIPRKSEAIPAFARKYHTTCSRCHTAVPKLNAFGKNFQLYGYQQPGDAKAGKINIPEDKNLSLIENIPIAILVENGVSLDKFANSSRPPTQINSPTVFHIFAADTIAPDLGFFGELATSGGVTDVGKISLSANFLGGKNVHLQVGNLDPTEHGVTEHDLFSRTGYSIIDFDLGGLSLANQHQGVRLYGTFGSTVSANLIHGKSDDKGSKDDAKDSPQKETAGPSPSRRRQQKEDEMGPVGDDPMNVLKGFLWEVGFYDSNLGGSASATRDASDFNARLNAYFNKDSFIGAFGYTGRTVVASSNDNNKYNVEGLDFSYNFGRLIEKTEGVKLHEWNLIGIGSTGVAHDPLGDGNHGRFDGYTFELNKIIGGRAIAFLRYDRVNAADFMAPSDGSNTTWPGGLNSALRTNSLTANYTFYPRTNVWTGIEYSRDMNTGNHNGYLGLVFSFAF